MVEAINDEDRKFMLDEFGLTGKQIREMSDEEYDELYQKVLFIVADEVVKSGGNGDTKRCRMAEQVAEKMYY